jgi:major membrane immunogen (membrane-anchored lipoprotein)
LSKEASYEQADKRRKIMGTKKPVKKVAKKVVKKGDVYKCGVCGLAVTVDEVCGCVDTCDIICCEKPMKAKKRA